MNRKEKIDSLVNNILDKKYGDIITHNDIMYCIQERRGTSAYKGILEHAKRRLLESGKMIESIRGVGYRVVYPDDYTKVSVGHVAAASRRIKKGVEVMDYAPVSNMTADGVAAYNRVYDRTKILEAAMAGARVEIKMLEKSRQHPLEAALRR